MLDPVSGFLADLVSNTLFFGLIDWLTKDPKADEQSADDPSGSDEPDGSA